MLLILLQLASGLARLFRPGGAKALVAENLLLKHQLLILRRSRRRAPNLRSADRLLFGLGSLFLSPRRLVLTAILIKPSTLLRCHRALTELKFRWLYSSGRKHKPGPKGPGPDLIKAIVELKRRNPHLGCPKIAQQLVKSFGIELDKDVVRRVLATHYRPDCQHGSPSWLTLLGHAKDSLWSVDLFQAESALLKTYWILLVIDLYTRRIIGFGVHPVAVDGPALCRMFNQVISGHGLPQRLSFDHDPLFEFRRWQANLRVLEIESVRSVPCTPVSHPFIERLTYGGSIWTGCSSGIAQTWNTSWSNSRATTTSSASTNRWEERHQKKSPEVQLRSWPASTITVGEAIAAAYSSYPSPLEQ